MRKTPLCPLHRQSVEHRDERDDQRLGDHVHQEPVLEIVVEAVAGRHRHAQRAAGQRTAHRHAGGDRDAQGVAVDIEVQLRRERDQDRQDDQDRRGIGHEFARHQHQKTEHRKEHKRARPGTHEIYCTVEIIRIVLMKNDIN